MTTLPPLSPPTPPAVPQAQAPVTVTAKAADLLARMEVGQKIVATVTAQTGNGQIEISTGQGSYQIRLPLPVPVGAQLVLQQAPAGALRLIAINGQVPTPPGHLGAMPNPAGLLIASIQGQAAPNAASVPNDVLQDPVQIGARPGSAILPGSQGGVSPGLLATVVSGPTGSFATPGVTPFPVGSLLTLRITDVTPAGVPDGSPNPAKPNQGAPAVPTAGTPPAATPSASQPPSAPPAVSQPGPQTNPALKADQPGPFPQGTPQQAASGPPVGTSPMVRGEVLAGHYGNKPVIATPIGTITLDGSVELSPGSRVSIEIVRALPPPAAMTTPRPTPPVPGAYLTALQDSLEVLRRAAPAEAEAMIRALPQAGPRLAMAMIATVQALRTGDVKGTATGTAGRALDAIGQKEAARKLLGAFEESSVQARGGGGDWRPHVIPLLNGAEIEEIHLYTRPPPEESDPDGQNGAGREEGSRFLVNLTLSRLGAIQFDGLVRREAKRFDLIIRTQEALPPAMRSDIGGLFAHACELSGVVGQVAFQAGRPFVATDSEPAAALGVVV